MTVGGAGHRRARGGRGGGGRARVRDGRPVQHHDAVAHRLAAAGDEQVRLDPQRRPMIARPESSGASRDSRTDNRKIPRRGRRRAARADARAGGDRRVRPPPPPRRSACGPARGTSACTPATCAPRRAASDGVHVEEPHRLQQLARARRPAPPRTSAAGTVRGHHQRHVDQRRRERRRSAAPGSPAPAAAARRGRAPSRWCASAARARRRTAGCSSPAYPTTAPSTSDRGAPARVPRRVLRRAHRDPVGRHAGRGERDPRRLDRVRPAGRRGPRPTSRPASTSPVSTAARCHGCVGHDRVRPPPSSSSDGRPVDAHAPAARPAARRGQEDHADLVQRQVALAAAEVAPQRAEQRRQQRRAQQRLLLGQRVGQPHRAAPRVVGGQPERVVHAGRDERVRQHLDVARPRPAPGRPSGGGAAPAVSPPPAGRERQHARDVVVAVEPDHLLDQVGRGDQVGPPGRRGDRRAARRPRRPCSRSGSAARPPASVG